jgi:polysaccharide biosynthesis protein PslG
MSTPTNAPAPATAGRTRIRAATAAVLALFLLAAAFAAQASAAKVPRDFFGIFAESPSDKDFRGMGDAGFATNRVPVNWAAVQAKRNGPYNWAQPDRGVYQSAKHGMRSALVVYGTPGFVHRPTGKGLYGPKSKADLKAWRKFSEAVARRYSRNGDYFDAHPEIDHLPVKVWIAWNEQNSKNNWVPKADPRAYGKLVKSFDRGISKVDPKAKIALGGMYGFPRDPKSMKAAKFLKKLYKVRGIAKHFDAINAHPYGSGVSDVKKQVNDLRSVARKAGDRNVGLLVGELGWASKGPKRSESVVGKKGQANRLRDGLQLLVRKRNAWNVLGAYVYTWRDFAAGRLACNWCPWSGLVTKKSKSKPALRAVKKVIKKKGR